MILSNTLKSVYNLNENIHIEFENDDVSLTYNDDLYFKIEYSFQGNYFIFNQKLINNKLVFDIKLNENNILVFKTLYYFDYLNLIQQNIFNSSVGITITAIYGDVEDEVYNDSTFLNIHHTNNDITYERFINTNTNYIDGSDAYIKFVGYENSSYTFNVVQYNADNNIISSTSELITPYFSDKEYKFITNLKNVNVLSNCSYIKIYLYKDYTELDMQIINVCNYDEYVNIVYLDDYYFYSNLYFYRYNDSLNVNSNIVNLQDEVKIINK
jgi:hypothetical protein